MATLSMRAPSMLPSITCSQCGQAIAIVAMGDHVCEPQQQQYQDHGYTAYPPSARRYTRASSFSSHYDDSQAYDSPQQSQHHFSQQKWAPAPLQYQDVSRNQTTPCNDRRHQEQEYRDAPTYARPDVYNERPSTAKAVPVPVSSPTHRRTETGASFRSIIHGRNKSVGSIRHIFRPALEDYATMPQRAGSTSPSAPQDSRHAAHSQEQDQYPYQEQPRQQPAPSPQQPRQDLPIRSVSSLSQHDRDEAKRNEFFSKSRPKAARPQQAAVEQHVQPSPLQRGPASPVYSVSQAGGHNRVPSRPERPSGEVDKFIASLKGGASQRYAEAAPAALRAAPMKPGLRAEIPSYRFPNKTQDAVLARSSSEPLNSADRAHVVGRATTTNDLRRLPSTSTTSSSGSFSNAYTPRQNDLPGSSIPSPALSRDSFSHGPSYSDTSAESTANSGRTGRSTPMSDFSASEVKSPPQLSYQGRGTVYNPYDAAAGAAPALPAQPMSPTIISPPQSPPLQNDKFGAADTNPYAPVRHRPRPVNITNPFARSPVPSPTEPTHAAAAMNAQSSHEAPSLSSHAYRAAPAAPANHLVALAVPVPASVQSATHLSPLNINPYATSRFEPQQIPQRSHSDRRVPWALDSINEVSDPADPPYTAPAVRTPSPATTASPFSAGPIPLERSTTDSSLASTSSADAYATSARPRHVCRGCSQPIVGKSIRAADGRLTGRYHRACFACTTCSAPFATSDVHVHGNRPYCERHWHVVNGSLCQGCDGGIEGQYLETEERAKYHPRCLCCATCRAQLGGEYFDVGGRVYCERHAVAEVRRLGDQGREDEYGQQQQQQQPMGSQQQGQQQSTLGPYGGGYSNSGGANGGWKAERRRTKLGMMQPSWIGI